MIFYLHPHLTQYFSSSLPLFDQLMALRGEVFRDQKGRITQRIKLGTNTYFIKQHTGVGWKEIIKNISCFRWPVISAYTEWRALLTCQKVGINAPNVLAFGERGLNPARKQSFILLEALTPTDSLEEIIKNWQKKIAFLYI